jgi:hypothetical protein
VQEIEMLELGVLVFVLCLVLMLGCVGVGINLELRTRQILYSPAALIAGVALVAGDAWLTCWLVSIRSDWFLLAAGAFIIIAAAVIPWPKEWNQ